MPTDITALPCRSATQAQDWSLVLISQGIESVITQSGEDGSWTLEVTEADAPRAKQSIEAYERENKTTWRREIRWTGLLFDGRAGLWFLACIAFHFLAEALARDFTTSGAVDRDAVLRGDWWRVFTAITLHADAAHLVANATIGFLFLGLAMGAYGPGLALLLSVVGGAAGNVISLLVHGSPFRSVGASGLVMAALGLLAAHSVLLGRHEKRAVWIGRGVIAATLLVVLLGLSPRSDVMAHVGGFVAGLLLGWLAIPWRAGAAPRPVNAVSLALSVGLVLLTWTLAMR